MFDTTSSNIGCLCLKPYMEVLSDKTSPVFLNIKSRVVRGGSRGQSVK